MILARLKEFWECQGNGLSSGYQPAFLTKRIVIDKDARLVSVESLTGETRGKRAGKTFTVPREQPQRTGAIRPRLVQDNANYSLGIAGPEDKPDKVAKRHDAYVEQLNACHKVTQESTLAILLQWLKSGGAKDPRLSVIDPDLDEILFEIDGTIPTDLPSLKAFWAKKDDATLGRCLVTGEITDVVDRMPFAIKGIPDGQTSGTMLVSVNNPSGESYGLEAALNSPIGGLTAEAVCNGLNLLLSDPKRSLRVGAVVYLCWTRETVTFDFMSFLDKPNEEDVRTLLEAPARGGHSPVISEPDFFVLALSANASRIVIRDFHETTLPAAQVALANWFRRLKLIGTDNKPVGAYRLAASLYREAKDIPKHVPIEILRSAITETPLPKHLLALAVKRNIAMQGPFYELNKKKHLSLARLALIKAVLLSHSTAQETDTLSALNPNHPDPAYHCGRLLSVLESIQRIAVPGLNATLVDKHFGRASGSPSVSFGGLLKDATSAHLPKLRKNRRGAYVALESRLQEVLGQIAEFPKSLDFERQGLFALGYYHQRADDFAAARANKELKELADAALPNEIATETETESE